MTQQDPRHDSPASDATRQPRIQRRPRVAAEVFGERLDLAQRFADMLGDDGVTRGLIGPRETAKLWDRHLLNCAVLETVLPHRTHVIDVGSGAGLPGVVLAIARPDLEVTLVEPLLRRVTWLEEVVVELGLGNVAVRRGRAQEFRGRLQGGVVTARAVARLATLAGWCAPLTTPGGRILAMKGQSAQSELDEDLPALRKLGLGAARVLTVGEGLVDPPVRLVEIEVESKARTRGSTQT